MTTTTATRVNDAATDGFSSYRVRCGDAPLLTAEQERHLGDTARTGDRDARDRLVRANLRLVMTVAREFLGRGLALDDLIGEGNLGLMRAAVKYDPSFGTRFSTYAAYWIKQAIREALLNTTATVRLPAHLANVLNKWRRAEHALSRELGRVPTPEEVAGRLGLTAAQSALVEHAWRAKRVLGDGRRGDEDGRLADVASAGGEGAGDRLEAEDERGDLERRLGRLDARSREVVERRYGLEGREPETLKAVGRAIGSTREWVRKLELRALARLAEAEAPAGPEEARGERALSAAVRSRSGVTPRWSEAARGLERPVRAEPTVSA